MYFGIFSYVHLVFVYKNFNKLTKYIYILIITVLVVMKSLLFQYNTYHVTCLILLKYIIKMFNNSNV